MGSRFPHNTARRACGTVLIVAMWIVLVLAGLALVFARSARVELLAAHNRVAAVQVEAAMQGVLQWVVAQTDTSEGEIANDPYAAGARQVGGAYVWILDADMDEDHTYAFGIRDESSRINLNTATLEMLLKLPNMTAELAAAILDWRDRDSDVSTGGAENEYYLMLPTPSYCKNDDFETVEELLLVKGCTPELLYGEDANRNGVLDANENDGADNDPPDNRDGHLDRGLFQYLTVYSREPNVTSSGEARSNVNDVNSRGLGQALRAIMSDNRYYEVMERVRNGRPFSSVLDFYFRSGLTIDEFAQVADLLTTTRDPYIRGLVNLCTAPREVLLCLPALEESDVDALVTKRQSSDTDLSNLAWVAETLSREKAVAIGSMVTTRSFQYSADLVAASGDGRVFRRARVVVDATTSPPRVLLWKDMTHLGWPLDPDILTALRAGTPPAAWVSVTPSGGT